MAVPLIVAIDGPSGVGKTTTSRLVARELNIPHIDTGAMYRAIALAAIRAGIGVQDVAALEPFAAARKIEFVPGERPKVLLDGEDISTLIRTPEVSMAASHVSAAPAVRRLLVRLPSSCCRRSGGVLEGRDIGTQVFPETPHKFFLTASAQVRADRRYRELLAKGTPVPYEMVLAESTQRDEQDSTRADSPLSYDESYEVIDTSALSVDAVVERIVASVRKPVAGSW